jgi:hypothetical protein
MSVGSIAKTFLLGSCSQGMSVTARTLFRQEVHGQLPGREDAAVAALPRPARAAPLPERRGALHRLQALRGGLPGARDHDRLGRATTARAARRATTSTSSSASTAASARKPARWTRSSRRASTSTTWSNRGENIMTKDKLLAVGERYEAMINADKAADAPYR